MVRVKILTEHSNLFGYSINYHFGSKRKGKVVFFGMDWDTCMNRLYFCKFEYFIEMQDGLGEVSYREFGVWENNG